MADLLRLYGPEELLGPDAYPYAWHGPTSVTPEGYRLPPNLLAGDEATDPAIKDLIRELAGYRCERCWHPYPPGIAEVHPRGQWTPCTESCTHSGPLRTREAALGGEWREYRSPPPVEAGEWLYEDGPGGQRIQRWEVEAEWRILTVHHLNGVKWDCRWWNLAALCQRCHLTIQARVVMERVYPFEHTEWFKPHAAGWYAADYLGEELTREETMARLDELLALELGAAS